MPSSRPRPTSIVRKWLAQYDVSAAPKRLLFVAAGAIWAERWTDTVDGAVELAAHWEVRLSNYLAHKLNEGAEVGRPPRLCFNSSAPDYVQGSCFVEPHDPLNVQGAKRNRARLQAYSDAISVLTPTDFEKLCGKTITLLGVPEPRITRRSADEGIDFYGKIDAVSMFYPQDLYPTIQRQLSLWIVGQAKHFGEILSGTAEIRELVGSLHLARAKSFGSPTPALPDLALRPADPVFLVFITSGFISKNAWSLLKSSGVVAMDGDMLAAFLADREIGLQAGLFSPLALAQWIEH